MTDRDLRMKILEILSREYSHARTELNYSNPFELLVSTILSAQSTDRQVNKITRSLFKKYSGPEDFARLTPEQLAEEIRGCGLYRNKSRHIIAAAEPSWKTRRRGAFYPGGFGGFAGVGRKTASVVLSNAFGQRPGRGYPCSPGVNRLELAKALMCGSPRNNCVLSYPGSVVPGASLVDLSWTESVQGTKAPLPCVQACRILPLEEESFRRG